MSNLPSLQGMPPEIIQNIFFNLCDIQSVANLAQSSKQFRDSLDSPQYQGSRKKLEILQAVVERQYGPLPELFQLATLGFRNQPGRPHPIHEFTLSFVKTLTFFGGVAEKWADNYPQMRWNKDCDSEFRRELRPHERDRFRRAMYRWWIYNKAFHPRSPAVLYDMPPSTNSTARFAYLRQFQDHEIVEMCEVYDIVEGMLYDICPDNAKIQKWYEESFPDQEPLYFGTYDTYRKQPALRSGKTNYRQNMVDESWGDRNSQAWFIEDVIKLDLDKLLYFCYELQGKHARKLFTDSLGNHFYDNPSTFRRDLQLLANQKDLLVDMEERGVSGGILWNSNADSVDLEHDKAQDDVPAGGSDSTPSEYEDSDEEYEYEPYASDDGLPDGILEEGVDDLGNFSPYMWSDGVLHPVNGSHVL